MRIQLSLLSLAMTFFSSGFDVWAQGNWTREYVGTPSFQLQDDPRLGQMIRVNLEKEQMLARFRNDRLGPVERRVEGLEKEQAVLEAEITRLNNQVTQSLLTKNQLSTQKTNLENRLPQLRQQVELKLAAVQGLETEITALKTQIQEISERQTNLTAQCTQTPNPECEQRLAQIAQRLDRVTQQLKNKEALLATATRERQQARQAVNRAQQEITETTAAIAEIDRLNGERATSIQESRGRLDTNRDQTIRLTAELATLRDGERSLVRDLSQTQNQEQSYRAELVQRILAANRNGAEAGINDGRQDGSEMAFQRGSEYGSRDGERYGRIDGTRRGQDIAYQTGSVMGEQEGRVRATNDGERDGSREGRALGLADAGANEGEIDGATRARASDAVVVGRTQGTAAGLARAETTGRANGERQGESEGIDQYENQALKDVVLQGSYYQGTFSRQVPGFPGDQNRGPRFNPNAPRGMARVVVQKAYSDGYMLRYRAELRNTYQSQIANQYNQYYANTYDAAFDRFSNASYPADERRGFDEANRRTYFDLYPRFQSQARARTRAQFSAHPDRESLEYLSAFQEATRASYQRVYEELRAAEFARMELVVFNQNIQAQTENYRARRLNEVVAVYKNHPVLKFINETQTDGGLRNVGVADGIYMPGESVLHNLRIENFGETEAVGVVVTLSSGESVTLPSLPGRSSVLVKGAQKSVIPANQRPESTFSQTLSVNFPLSATSAIQSRYYQDSRQSLLRAATTQALTVKYPVEVRELQVVGQPLLGESNAVTVSLTNIANRAYTKNLKLELKASASTQVISKEFSSLSGLTGTVTARGAEISVNDERDVYSPFNLSLVVSEDGVVVGRASGVRPVIVKALYREKAGATVVVANSDAASRELLDLVADYDGLQNISVLDTSIMNLNQRVVGNGLKNKSLVVFDRGGVLASIDSMMSKSENISLMLLAQDDSPLARLGQTATFRYHVDAPLRMTGLGNVPFIFSNPLLNRGQKSSHIAFQMPLRTYRSALTTLFYSRLSATELIQRVKTNLNAQSFQNPTAAQKQLGEAIHLHILKEVGIRTKAYTESGGGLFGGNRDRDLADRVRDDQTLLHNRLIKEADTSMNNSNAGVVLMGLDSFRMAEDAFNRHPVLSRKLGTTAISNRLFGSLFMRGSYKGFESDVIKRIRTYNRSLGDQLRRESLARFAPFQPTPIAQQ